ncbi:MAG: rhodanese-like domain-containing protein [Parcubacteria group bacterium]
MNKSTIAVVVVIVIIAGLGGWWYFTQREETKTEEIAEEMTEEKNILLDTIDKAEEAAAKYQDIAPAEAEALVDDNGDAVIIDVSPNYAQGHLLKSINYYVGDGSLDKAIPSLDKEKTYLVYCHVDSAAILGAKKLTDAGFGKVYRLEGNYVAWVEAGYPVITDVSANDSALKGDLPAVDGSTSSGQGYVLRKDTGLEHLVTAALPDPETGKFYEGWLVDQEPTVKFFSTGQMFKTPEGDWRLEYIASQSYSEYDQVVITLETKDDGQPEKHVIEGTVQ